MLGPAPRPAIPDAQVGDRAVVLTAYPPVRACLPPPLARPYLDPWRACWHASALETVMDQWGAPSAWVHGGAATSLDLRVGRTRVVSNGLWPDGAIAGFDPCRTIVV